MTSLTPELLDDSGVTVEEDGSEWRLTLTPRKDAFEMAQLSLSLRAGEIELSKVVNIEIRPINDAPVISIATEIRILAGRLGEIPFSVADDDTPDGELVLRAMSLEPSKIAQSSLKIGSSGSGRVLRRVSAHFRKFLLVKGC